MHPIFTPIRLGLFGLLASLGQSVAADVGNWPQLIFRDRLETQWSEDGKSLSYRTNTGPGRWETIHLDLATWERTTGKTPRPGSGSSSLVETMPAPGSGPAVTIAFENTSDQPLHFFWRPDEDNAVAYGVVDPGRSRNQGTYAGHVWEVRTKDGESLGFVRAETTTGVIRLDGTKAKQAPPKKKEAGWKSPDGRYRALLRDHNVWIADGKAEPTPWTTNGTAEFPYRGEFHWSPDGRRALVIQEHPAQKHPVHLIESSPDDQVQPKLQTQDYLKPGDVIARPELRILTAGTTKGLKIDPSITPDAWSLTRFHWSRDGGECFVLYNQRGHQRLQVLGIDAVTGKVRTVVDERSSTFIDYSQKTELHWLDRSHELIWASERDGWNHLYLYDAKTGAVKRQLTSGDWVVRKVLRVDEDERQAWFMACGIHAGQDPYHQHLARVDLDTAKVTVLTDGDGTHEIEFSPDRSVFIDRWSRIDVPTVHDLRRSSGGGLITELEKAEVTELRAAGWSAPERFVAKGRDGTTDIHGIIIRPADFDPAKSYPVIENIYAGPHGQHVPKAFSIQKTNHELAELGFIIVRIDGMGTNWRSKAFHDVCWKNLKDAGFPDRIAWIRAAAKSRPWMDLSRVGIYGGSAGGQNALGALLFHGDFYRVAVADCGCHDNRMDKIWWNEAWMGWPVGPEYADNSNVTHAHKLTGKLLLIVGELDRNVDPASTMQVVDALVKADKDFDLLVMPGVGHGAADTPYGKRRRRDFLAEHLLGGGTQP